MSEWNTKYRRHKQQQQQQHRMEMCSKYRTAVEGVSAARENRLSTLCALSPRRPLLEAGVCAVPLMDEEQMGA